MKGFRKVQVLMSTYNGEKYLAKQLDSILNQNIPIELLIRDDGSHDNTKFILQEYAVKYDNIHVIYGENVGACESFFELIWNANDNMDFYGFADQDDIWLSNKISSAVEQLEVVDNSIKMYCGALELVDSELNIIKRKENKKVRPSFGNAMIENIAAGCTVVFSNELRKLMIHKRKPNGVYMHDWWIYLVCSAFGKVVYDTDKYILYRQHENNVVGNAKNTRDLIRRRVRNLSSYRSNVKRNLLELIKIYDDEGIDKELINLVVDKRLCSRMKLLLNEEIVRQSFRDTVLSKAILFFRREK